MYPQLGPTDPPEKPPKSPPGGPGTRESSGADVKERVEKPRLFKVLLHNDDFTTMEFVVEVLMQVFRKSRVEATRIMLLVHNAGKGVAGVLPAKLLRRRPTWPSTMHGLPATRSSPPPSQNSRCIVF